MWWLHTALEIVGALAVVGIVFLAIASRDIDLDWRP